nr:Ankyrin [Hymenolepis microstoma]
MGTNEKHDDNTSSGRSRNIFSDFFQSVNSKLKFSNNSDLILHDENSFRNRRLPFIYSHHVPLEQSLLDFAASESGTTSVGTVLVINTGGAIGMQKVEGVYRPKQHFLTKYLFQMPIFNDLKFWDSAPQAANEHSPDRGHHLTQTPSTVSVPLAMPLNENGRRIIYRFLEYNTLLDSSDCNLDFWVKLALDIEKFYDHFDGFVILHGTDTLPYAASALSFILENLSKPIVMTGSELPIDRLRNDGRHNLLGSLLIAGGGFDIPEVTVFVQNELYRGNRVVKTATTDLVAFTSPNSKPLAEMKEVVKVYEDRIFRRIKHNSKKLTIHTNLCPDVAILRLFPSISVEAVRSFFKPPMKGVILETYGTGNVPSNYKELMEVFKEAYEQHKIIMLNVTQCWKGSVAQVYETGAILNKVGAISGADITTEAALMKLAYVLGKWSDTATQRRMLGFNLRGEITEPLVETRRHHRSSLERNSPVEGMATMATTTGLGCILVNAENAELTNVWSPNLFRSLVCAAAMNDEVEVLQELLRIAGHFEFYDKRHVYPLHVAAGAGAIGSCRLMLENGVNANVVDKRGFTPLSWAVCSPNASASLIKLMRKFGCRFSSITSARARETNDAALAGKINRLKFYQLAGLSLKEYDAEGRAPLHTAVAYHQTETVRYLITPKAVNKSFEGNDDMEMPEMSGAGVDPAQPTRYGTTALEEAKERGFDDIVLLLENALKNH